MISIGKIGILAITAPGAAICYEELVSHYGQLYGKYNHPEIFLHNINFYEYNVHLQNKDWDKLSELMLVSIYELAKHDLDFIIIPANTVHIVIDKLKQYSPIEILSVLDVVSEKCVNEKFKRVAVLGTKWTMSTKLYKNIFDKNKIQLIVPNEEEQNIIHDMILNYLIPQTNINIAENILTEIVSGLISRCDAVALACTELPMVLNKNNCNTTLIDTTRTLAHAAAKHIHELKKD